MRPIYELGICEGDFVLPVEIVPVDGSTLVLRARGSELLILPQHIGELKSAKNPKEFTSYFLTNALLNRPARKLFEAWLRKDKTLWQRIYRTIQNDMEVEPAEASTPKKVEEPAPKAKEAKASDAEEAAPKKKTAKKSPEKKVKKTTKKPVKKTTKAPAKAKKKVKKKTTEKVVKKTTKKKAAVKKKSSTKKKKG